MSLSEAFFVSPEIHKRMVTLADGSEHELYFREVPASDWHKYTVAARSDDDDVKSACMQHLIAASLCEQDGAPAMTVQQAMKLKVSALTSLWEAVVDVNAIGKRDEKKTSDPTPENGSGTS